MKQHFLFLAVSLSICVMTIACKKQSNTTPTALGCRLMQVKGLNDTLYTSYEYDAFGKISKQSNYVGKNTLQSYDTYTYLNNMVVVKTYNTGAFKQSQISYILGSNGYASLSVSVDSNATSKSSDSTTYTYDVNGYLITAVQSHLDFYYSGGNKRRTTDTTIYSYSNGNLMSISSLSAGSPKPIFSYTYTDKVDKIGLLFASVVSPKLIGKANTNLVLKESVFIDSGNGPSYASLSYEFDANGYVTKVTSANSGSSTSTSSIYYSYNCN